MQHNVEELDKCCHGECGLRMRYPVSCNDSLCKHVKTEEERQIQDLAQALEGWNRAQWSYEHIATDLVKFWNVRSVGDFEKYHFEHCKRCTINK